MTVVAAADVSRYRITAHGIQLGAGDDFGGSGSAGRAQLFERIRRCGDHKAHRPTVVRDLAGLAVVHRAKDLAAVVPELSVTDAAHVAIWRTLRTC